MSSKELDDKTAGRLEAAKRLKIARKVYGGFRNHLEAAAALGLSENTYKPKETGRNGFNAAEAQQFSKIFRVSAAWLLTGAGSAQPTNLVAVMGRIGAGAEILPEHEQVPPEGLFEIEIEFPAKPNALAFEVEGDSMWPRYDSGDVIICGKEGTNPEQIVGWEAAVRTSEGKRFLKRVTAGSKKGLYNLESHNASPIRDVQLEWVAQVDTVVRRGSWIAMDAAAKARVVKKTSTPKKPKR